MSNGFHEVRFPLRLSLSTSGGPKRLTDIVDLTNGREQRNARWRHSRRVYDAGSGLRAVDDLYAVVAFFEARGGQLYGFRFRDPLDAKSCGPGEAVSPFDQAIGTGDGVTATFRLVKSYGDAGGEWRREILKPVAGTVRVAVDGVELPPSGFSSDPVTGIVMLSEEYIPPPGALVQAGFEFDVPVRFDTDRIDVNLEAFRAGRIPAIPLVEVLP
ncbi:DUF2460 domain-containing protein [Ciceribacter selenitireducens]|uniref:DUF2460 domain-containing protein n=1 Tax=Ciceribacter selenitireducens ATCC BAA-1503 TaxID=1336235 RepID=A0A376AKR7_9HYPH|nr:DUF2460 domain-containing protein [Ciceribacter selenitireducens]SSC68003.1 unnamed protein product [Ciceribacter selenitireducens ATCC BAA-1503]